MYNSICKSVWKLLNVIILTDGAGREDLGKGLEGGEGDVEGNICNYSYVVVLKTKRKFRSS